MNTVQSFGWIFKTNTKLSLDWLRIANVGRDMDGMEMVSLVLNSKLSCSFTIKAKG